MGAPEGQPRILVIDDDSSVLEFLQGHLAKLGFDVSTAGDGITALAAAHREQPDLILLDLILPHIDGIRLSRRLRGDEKFRKVPIILLTAQTDTRLKVEALQAGANDYVTKPFQVEELVARVEAHLKTKLLQDQVEEMQEKLVTTGKREAIIEMAGATAHELNQPLTAILGRVALLERKIEKEGPAGRDVAVIRDQGERLARLIQKLARVSKYDTKTYVGDRRIVDLEAAAGAIPEPSEKTKAIRVLVAGGGEPALAKAIETLGAQGFLVDVAPTAEVFATRAVEGRPEAFVLDPASPCWQGFEPLQPIQKARHEDRLPALVILPEVGGSEIATQAAAQGYYAVMRVGGLGEELPLRLRAIVQSGSVAARAARLEDEIQQLQSFDRLTGLHNRRHFLSLLRSEVRRARRYRYPLSVALLDVDDFAAINRQWGQDFGDLVLKELALVLKGTVREVDILGRYGGEEFCMILPHTAQEDGIAAADRLQGRVLGQSVRIAEELRKSVEGYLFERADRSAHVTVSLGIAGVGPGEAVDEEELLQRCEWALQEAKSQGKNQIAVYGPSGATPAPESGPEDGGGAPNGPGSLRGNPT